MGAELVLASVTVTWVIMAHQGTSGVITLSRSGQVTHDREIHPVIVIHQKSEVGALKIKR